MLTDNYKYSILYYIDEEMKNVIKRGERHGSGRGFNR